MQWLVPAPGAAQPAAAAADPPWQITLKELQLQNGRLQFADAQAGRRPVRLDLTQLAAGLQNVQLRGDRTLAPLRWQLSGNVAGDAPLSRAARPAAASATRTLDGRGELALQPLQVRGALRIDGFPVQALEPYFGDALGLDLRRARLGYQGDVALQDAPAGRTLALRGDGRVGDLQLYTRQRTPGSGADADELLRWQTLTLQGLDVALQPAQRPRVLVRELALDNFYSKLVITENGRFNLQDVGASPGAADSASASADPPVDLTISATRISRGTVDFTDRFIQPNYSADLSELQGTLGAFRTGSRDMATLALRGKVQRTGSLDLSGQLNPTAQPLALDLRARATDLELTPLSPYAGKYAGYGIERGKLGMDLTYRIAPDGTLDAKNQIVINQLTFGDRVESPSATQLPVLLAVALLKDRNGVIDLNIPISGSINDPQFSVFGLVVKVIGNVLTKAVTAPFSLLSGGGDDDLSTVVFAPGTATLTAEGRSTADKVAQALADRPALTLTLHGQADGPTEQNAYRAAALEKRLLAAAQRERTEAGAAPEALEAPLSAEERSRLLRALARQLHPPAKPAPGKAAASTPATGTRPATEPSDAELAATLAAAMPVSADLWRELAAQRGEAVRDALLARQLSNERIFLGAPKVGRGDSDAAAWKPSAAMTLSAR
jgi:outer membrane protein OmpA-like peptidoglycan-associated protein